MFGFAHNGHGALARERDGLAENAAPTTTLLSS